MKTRIIHTKFWEDTFVLGLNRETKLFFNYLLTNPLINISGVYELPEQYIQLHTGLTEIQISNAKTILEKNNKVIFYKGWVKVINIDKYNNYRNSPKNEIAYEREISLVPTDVLDYLNTYMDTSIDTSIYTPRNHKSETINKKSETRNQKEGTEIDEIIKHYNEIFNKQTKSSKAWKKNAIEWLKEYSVEDIKQAMNNWKKYGWWIPSDEASLVILFRTKNKTGDCDNINELLNLKKTYVRK